MCKYVGYHGKSTNRNDLVTMTIPSGPHQLCKFCNCESFVVKHFVAQLSAFAVCVTCHGIPGWYCCVYMYIITRWHYRCINNHNLYFVHNTISTPYFPRQRNSTNKLHRTTKKNNYINYDCKQITAINIIHNTYLLHNISIIPLIWFSSTN